jgi:ubiquinone/menaquinone biosynthesis C-methylase UbiE
MNVYDGMASDFDRRRALPNGVPETIRAIVVDACQQVRPRILDIGAGSGRIGQAFVRAGDNYIGADLSFGMLRAFGRHVPFPCVIQADGARLPFVDAAFDAVLLIQVLSGASGWRELLGETMRVLRRTGALIAGRVVAPEDGIDAQMKSHLAAILGRMNVHPYRDKPRDDALAWLARQVPNPTIQAAANWIAERTPAAFLERHGRGARFSVLDPQVRHDAMRQLGTWATDRFGSLDTVFAEPHRFELIIHRFQQGTTIECQTLSETRC